jgi:hypothetical protein
MVGWAGGFVAVVGTISLTLGNPVAPAILSSPAALRHGKLTRVMLTRPLLTMWESAASASRLISRPKMRYANYRYKPRVNSPRVVELVLLRDKPMMDWFRRRSLTVVGSCSTPSSVPTLHEGASGTLTVHARPQ